MAAPCTTFSPTPPQPRTAIDCPIFRPARLFMSPRAVVTEQPSKVATSKGISAGMGVKRFSETTEYSQNVVTQPPLTTQSPHLYLGVTEWMPVPFRQCKTT